MSARKACAWPLALFFATALLWGCTAKGRPGQQPSWRRPPKLATSSAAPREIRFSPKTPAVQRYNDPPRTEAPSSPLGDAIVAAVNDTSGRIGIEPPRPDGRLYAAVEELAKLAPADAPLPYSLVEFTMQRHGIIEPSPHLVVIWGDAGDPDAIMGELSGRLPEILQAADFARLGVGSARRPEVGESVIVLAFQQSFVRTEPIPRSLPAAGSFRLQGEVLEPFHQPQVFVTREDGEVERVSLVRIGTGGFRAELSCDRQRGREQVEITAEDKTGSTVLANFPIWCDARPPAEITVTTPELDTAPVASQEQAEKELAELVNRDRTQHGLPPLEIDPGLAEVARAHSKEMFDTGVVAHISPTTGSAVDRVERHGIKSSVVLENVARAYGIGEAEEGLMNSPGHRANILSAQATHMGLGVVLGDEVAGRRELFITQLFIYRPPKLDVAAARARIERIIQRTRTLARDEALDQVAADFARQVAAGVPTEQASSRSAARLKKMKTRYDRVTTVVTAVADLAAFDPSETLRDKRITHYGLGLAQGDHERMGEDAIYIVLLLGQE